MPQKKCDFQKNQNKKNWRIRLFGGSNVVNKLITIQISNNLWGTKDGTKF